MHNRLTGASNRLNNSSEIRAEILAPTPPVLVDSSNMTSLFVLVNDLAIVSISNGFNDRNSIKSMSNPSSLIESILASASFTPCKYVSTVTALPALIALALASCKTAALLSGIHCPN